MAHDPFNFSFSLGSGRTQAGDSTRYIAPPFQARMVAEGEAMVVAGRGGELHRTSSAEAQLLGLCDRFRTLAEHGAHAMRQLRLPQDQQAMVDQALDHLARRSLLMSEARLREALSTPTPDVPDKSDRIGTLFVRTCARPDTLERLLAGIARLDDTAGLERCVVLDDDAGTAQRETRAVIDHFRTRLPVALHYVSRETRRKLVAGIALRAEADADRLGWFIEGNPDDTEPGYGAGVNLALLLGAGRTIAMIDDDSTLSSYLLPESREVIEFRPVPSARVVFPDPERPPQEQFEPGPVNPIAAHSRWLGAHTSTLTASAGVDANSLFEHVDPQLIYDLGAGGRVRITTNGTLGDPGTSGIQWLYAETAEHLRPLCGDQSRYRRLIERRQVARSPASVQATTTISLMTTTLTGIDNRDLLLPTQPRGGNEDLLLGALTSYLYPTSLHATLPYMLYHMRPQPRHWSADDLDRARNPNRGNLLAEHVERLAEFTRAIDPPSRIAVLRDWLSNLAAMPPRELDGLVAQALVTTRGDTIERLQAVRTELDPPPRMAADFDRVARAHAEISDRDRKRLAAVAASLPDFARHYAGGLDDWRRAWAHCREQDIDEWLQSATGSA